ncbi:hypothetical protein GSI_12980 [Ganoderma sinense ZZ0214-1]|uniref:VLRF1 domain-containing protein n=1 Tax=Ganoderma sinense ZZ0214-1 TaxID=1077348 RepID=A0A2G8RUA3_9APHY|nr:hypothetical protein GSI_12980 [Ganoderma sinense ZZ0214-1]
MSSRYQYHLFSLPPDLLDSLIPRNVRAQPPQPAPAPTPETPPPVPQVTPGSRACNICLGATFVDVDDQRAHFRSDWHRYNIKIRLNGRDPVSEPHFAQLVDALDDSISGSASSSDEESDDDAVATLVNRTRKLSRPSSPDSVAPTIPQTPLVWFHSPPSTQIGVYRTIFSPATSPSDYLSDLKQLQSGGEHGRTWAIFMTAGGHFAGAVVRVKRPDADDDDAGLTKRARRKQGGSQSINDNAKSKAVSAGAMLRRYGEQALRDDIRNLLTDWADEIHDCERIFIRASVSNRRIFLDYEGAVIEKGDERLRGFPFPTRRPTQAELNRCLQELTRVKISHLTEEALRAQDEALLASLPKPKPQSATASHSEVVKEKEKDKLTVPQLSPEEESLRDKWTRLLDMIKRGRLDTLKTLWEREGPTLGGIDATVPEWANEKGGTLLQVAAHAGQEDVTKWILEDLRADPTLDVPSAGASSLADDSGVESDSDAPRLPRGGAGRRTAYDLARTKAVRNVFRRAAAAHPDWWDWLGNEDGARVPSVLSAEMEEVRDEKKKARRKGLKDKLKEREAQEKEREAVTPSPPPPSAQENPRPKEVASNGPRKLGGASGGAESVAGLTPEMRAKIERERRARAAEARLKALGGGR